MTKQSMKEPTEQSLLKELETGCNEAVNAQGRFWQIFGFMVIIGLGSLVLLGRDEPHELSSVVFFAIAGALASGAVWMLVFMYWRVLWRQRVRYARDREIEARLGLRRNIYVDALDHFACYRGRPYASHLTEADHQSLQALHQEYPPPVRIATVAVWFAVMATAAWVARVFWEVALFIGGRGNGGGG